MAVTNLLAASAASAAATTRASSCNDLLGCPIEGKEAGRFGLRRIA